MRYILAILPWDLPPIAPLDVPKFLETVKGMGFDGISLAANLWAQDKLDTTVLPHAQAVRAAGMGLLLRVVASTEHSDWVPKACRLDDLGLNIYHPRAKAIMRKFCTEVRESKLHSLATGVTIGWSSSWESTAMEMPRDEGPVPDVVPPDKLTPSQEQVCTDTVRQMIGVAVSVLGNKIPIGGQRSSLWHIPDQRLELPVYCRENLNVVEDAWWQGREHLPESIALQKAAMPGKPMISGWDYDGYLADWHEPWSELPWQEEMLERFKILKENGVAAQVVHCSPENLLRNADTFKAAGEIMSA